MKRFSITLTALLVTAGLSVSAQATTHTKAKKAVKVGNLMCQPVASNAVAKKHTTKKVVAKAKKAPAKTVTHTTTTSGEINPNIPADLRINQSRNVAEGAVNSTSTAVTPVATVVPVTRVVQTAPATQITRVEPVNNATAKKTVTTTVPVAVQTVPVVVTP